jgi:hypothetical protein
VIPERLVFFRFLGYGPDLSLGLAALTQERNIVVTDAPNNPGTSLTNAVETAIPMAREALGVAGDDLPVYQWTPRDPLKPDSLWRVTSEQGGPQWTQVPTWHEDPDLSGAIEALRRAGGGINDPADALPE